MATFEYVSARGDVLSLSGGTNYQLVNIDSQTAAGSNISSLVVSGVDGDSVNNIQAQPRTIIIDLRITADVENTKQEILNVIKIKKQGTLVWKHNGRTLEIKGIVESIEMPRWVQAAEMQITIHCEQPFWEDVEELVSEINLAISLHYFTTLTTDMLYFPEAGIVFGAYDTSRVKSLHNAGDVDVGLVIEIIAYKTVTNPIIYNQDNEFFGCGYGTGAKKIVMSSGDTIRINTTKNEKSVTLNGVSILDKIKPQSTWLQLLAGDNTFAINSAEESIDNMTFSMTYKQRYI